MLPASISRMGFDKYSTKDASIVSLFGRFRCASGRAAIYRGSRARTSIESFRKRLNTNRARRLLSRIELLFWKYYRRRRDTPVCISTLAIINDPRIAGSSAFASLHRFYRGCNRVPLREKNLAKAQSVCCPRSIISSLLVSLRPEIK